MVGTGGGVDGSAFLKAMGVVATGVTVVAASDAGTWTGQTVSAMCSVSSTPPILLVCVHERSPLVATVARAGAFCVNVLATEHDHVADTFAGRPWPGKQRWDFSCGDWTAARSGSPRLINALASFDCTVHTVVPAGTHHVLFGRVSSIEVHESVPLVYANRDYGRPEPIEPSRFARYPEAHPANRFVPTR